MIRLLGAITGSALALATLLVVIGVPQFRSDGNDIERAVVTLPLPTSPVDMPLADTESAATAIKGESDSMSTDELLQLEKPESSGQPAVYAEQAGLPNDAAETATLPPEMTPDESQFANALADSFADSPTDTIAKRAHNPDVIDDAQSWYAFWSPFRSELAANGFVAQLQSVTGLDYRVVRLKPGVYEVAFAYSDDNDITANLTQITAATGLDLPQ
ncbi:MAG: hypothetical protein HKN77_00465 [Woeseiaceae bacterium]|nr:hypothetical protein [Woeseiaceae bacterium]